jgi:hypothetical protein
MIFKPSFIKIGHLVHTDKGIKTIFSLEVRIIGLEEVFAHGDVLISGCIA